MKFDEYKAEAAIRLLRKMRSHYEKPAVLWSTGISSTVLLSLMREAFDKRVPFPVIHLDTGKLFPEVQDYRDKLAHEWGLELIVVGSEEAGIAHPMNRSRRECCLASKVYPLDGVIEDQKYDAILLSVRQDKPKTVTVALLETFYKPVIVPVLQTWGELDMWLYLKSRVVPINPLYQTSYVEDTYGVKGRRCKAIECRPCNVPIVSRANTILDILEELTRPQIDEDEEIIKDRLRALGYIE